MKKIFFFMLCRLSKPIARAQSGYGFEAGLGIAEMHFAPGPFYASASNSAILGGKLGGFFDVDLNHKFYLQVGLRISRQGDQRDFSYHENDSFNEKVTQTITLGYAEMPFALLYKTGIQGKGRVTFGIGVTPAYVLAGRNKLHATGTYGGVAYDTSFNIAVITGKNANPVGSFDLGLDLSAGYELGTGLFFKAFFRPGINDIGLGGESDKNRLWGIAGGYIFGHHRNINNEGDDLIDHSDVGNEKK